MSLPLISSVVALEPFLVDVNRLWDLSRTHIGLGVSYYFVESGCQCRTEGFRNYHPFCLIHRTVLQMLSNSKSCPTESVRLIVAVWRCGTLVWCQPTGAERHGGCGGHIISAMLFLTSTHTHHSASPTASLSTPNTKYRISSLFSFNTWRAHNSPSAVAIVDNIPSSAGRTSKIKQS